MNAGTCSSGTQGSTTIFDRSLIASPPSSRTCSDQTGSSHYVPTVTEALTPQDPTETSIFSLLRRLSSISYVKTPFQILHSELMGTRVRAFLLPINIVLFRPGFAPDLDGQSRGPRAAGIRPTCPDVLHLGRKRSRFAIACPTEDECLGGSSRALRVRSRVELSAPTHAREHGRRCVPANPNSGGMYVQPNDGQAIRPAIHDGAPLRRLYFSSRTTPRHRRIEPWRTGCDTI